METITISKRKPTGAWFKTYFSILLIALIFGFSSCQDESSNQLTEDYLKGLELGTPSGTSQSAAIVYFEKRRFTRTTEAPFEEIVRLENPNFEHFNGDFVLKVQNGSDKQTRVSSAEIIVDGETIVSQSDFSKNVSSISKQLNGLTPSSDLEVRINSSPGSFIDIWIEGNLKSGHAQISSDGGVLDSENNLVHIEFPPQALTYPTLVSVETVDVDPNDPIFLEYHFTPVFSKVIFNPDETFFNELVKVTVRYNDTGLTLEQEQHLYFVQVLDNALVPVEFTDIDTDNNLITAYLEHFSEYVVGYTYHVESGIPFVESSAVIFDLFLGFHWDVDELKVYISPDSDHYLWDNYNRVNLVRTAIKEWEKYQGRFKIVFVSNSADANIVLQPTPKLLAGLAKTNIPIKPFRNRFTEKDQIAIKFLSTLETSQNVYSNEEAMISIIGHEMGHALGLAHTQSYYSKFEPKGVPIMWVHTLQNELSQLEWKRIITGLDVIRLQKLYGKPRGIKVYKNEFSTDLADWIPINGYWQIQNGGLMANYGIGCGSIGCPQADLILKDQFQPSGDWELSVDFTYAPDNSYNYGASGAAIIIWESASKKIRIGIGNGGTVPWGTNPETIMPVSFCAWDGTWDNSRWNYINYTWSPREWHTMTIDKTGNVYTVYVDNDYLWRYTDNYLNGTGKIGLQTYGPKIYDNFIIRTKD